MSRRIKQRLRITGTLVCQTPVHVGGMESTSSADLSLSVNGAGKVYVPGTSLAGALRAWCVDAFGSAAVGELFGPNYDDADDGTEEAGHASYLIVDDAVLEGTANASPEIREGVGIDRFTGAAADRIKFSREVIPAGSRLKLRLTLEEPSEGAFEQSLVPDLLRALRDGEVKLGAAQTRGLGAIYLTDLRVTRQDFSSKTGILAVLSGQSVPASASGELEGIFPCWAGSRRQKPSIEIAIKWKPVGPLMVRASVDGMTIDSLPLVSRNGADLRLVLPGSSIKGALRSQAERICSTVFGSGEPPPKDFNDQIACHELILVLFGARNTSNDGKDPEGKAPLLGRSTLAIADCYSHAAIAQNVWRSLTTEYPTDKLDEKNAATWINGRLGGARKQQGEAKPYLDPAMHVAIDRWTGGAADGLLFSVLEPWSFGWQDIVLQIDPDRLAATRDGEQAPDSHQPLAAFALLLLILRDLANGDVPLGFAVNRGMGSLEVETVSVAVKGDVDGIAGQRWPWLAQIAALAGCRAVDYATWPGMDAVQSAWTSYLDRGAR